MTTSNIYSYQLTRDELITASLRKLGVISEGQTPTAQNLADGQVALNSTLAQLRAVGMPLWSRAEYTFTPTTSTYTIGTGYTLNTPYPVKLLQAVRRENGANIPMEIEGREDFNIYPTSSGGSPLKVNYQQFVNYGIISFWPSPSATNTSTVTLVYQRPFQFFTASGQTLDFPEEWYNAIIYSVAVLLAPEWGVPLPDRQVLKSEAKDYIETAQMTGQEAGSFFVSPTRNY